MSFKAGHQVVIAAFGAKLHGSLKSQRNHTRESSTLYDIAQQVVERNGFTPAISANLPQVNVPHCVQHGQSDADFLQQRADEYDCTLKCTGGRQVFFLPGEHQAQRMGYQLNIREMSAIPHLVAVWLTEVNGHPSGQFNVDWITEEVTEHLDEKGFWQSLKAVSPSRAHRRFRR